MDESHIPEELRQSLSERIDQTKAQRLQVVEDYVRGDFALMADASQIAKRLDAKGQHAQAIRVQELSGHLGRVKSMPVEMRGRDRRLAESNQIVHESIVGFDNTLSVRFLHRGSQKAASVARIVTLPHNGLNGTGFLISPRLLMTNHHVIRDEEDARNNVAQFDYGDDELREAVTFRFRPDEYFVTSHFKELDCTVVAVEPQSHDINLADYGWCQLADNSDPIQVGERVNIIHHPSGGMKQVSIRDNFVTAEAPERGPAKYWLYASDTKGGSSGSPVFDEVWNVVALHHAGLEINDPAEVAAYRQILQRSGVGGLDHDSASIEINEGIKINFILKWLESEAAGLSGQKRRLYEQFLTINHQGVRSPMTSNRPRTNSTSFFPAVDGGKSGGVTVNMFFDGGHSDPQHDVSTEHRSQETDVDLRRTLELFKKQVSSQKSVFTALGVLQGIRESRYLPSDAQIEEQKNDYYGALIDDVANDVPSAAELYDQLNALSNDKLDIVNQFPETMRELESFVDHQRRPERVTILEGGAEYARARAFLYTDVDLHPHRMLQCPYTEAIIAPEQLMLRDLITELDMDHLLPQRFRNNRYLNCEHIVPQSWFKDDHPDGISDLHHLVAADGGANNFRSNCPYREVNGQGELGPENNPSYIEKAGRKHLGTFEPSKGKPLVARATLYFILTYKGALDSTKYNAANIETLKDWAKSSPPSKHELHRNIRAAEAQGNRNPLIDFPDWIDKIDFSQGIG